jgi:hypothetical protein
MTFLRQGCVMFLRLESRAYPAENGLAFGVHHEVQNDFCAYVT